MAEVTSTLPQLPYARRVSFNNLQPDDLEAGTPSDLNRFQSYSMAAKECVPRSQGPDLTKLLSNYSFAAPATAPLARKKLKLPEPPERLILKNKLSLEQLRLNVAYAIKTDASLAKELNDLVHHPPESVPRLELARIISESGTPAYLGTNISHDDELPPPRAPEGRRKLYSGMTNEELMALDPQFSKPNSSDLKNFKFDSLGLFVPTSRKNSAPEIFVSPPTKTKRVLYPSSNENNYKSVSLTVKHEDFDKGNLFPRTILTIISGRKHTWNSLDWLLLTNELLRDTPGFLQNGDHLVVAALVPLKFLQTDNKNVTGKKDSGEQKVQQKCEELLNYVLSNLPDPNIRLKITVELVMDVEFPDPMSLGTKGQKRVQTGTKFMVAHLFRQYQPTLIVMGNKSTSLNFKYPRRISRGGSATIARSSSIGIQSSPVLKATETETEHYLIKLSSYLIRYSTVPVIIAGNSTIFHRKPAPKAMPTVTFTGLKNHLKSILESALTAPRQSSYSSDASIESYDGEQPNRYDSNSLSTEGLLAPSSTDLEFSSDSFAAMILQISLKSLSDLKIYLEQIKADQIPTNFADSKVHQAYVSMEQSRPGSSLKRNSIGAGAKAYKVKSLISYNEEDEKINEKMINDKKLKKSISRNSAGSVNLGGLEEKSLKKKKKKSFLQKIGLKKS